MRNRQLKWEFGVWLFCGLFIAQRTTGAEMHGQGWPTYGGDAGGTRYSGLRQITPQNVRKLTTAWTYHTGSLATPSKYAKLQDFEATPVLLGRRLLLTTPFDMVIALDAGTGRESWRFDPKVPGDVQAANYTSRGVATWVNPDQGSGPCAERVFVGTLDARLIALDAANGQPCEQFGRNGEVDLKAGVPTQSRKPYRYFGNTSPPTVVGETVIVGSAVGDNQAVEAEPGYVRGFDARSGALRWTFDPTPWARMAKVRTGGSNTWGVIAADVGRDMVFLPTGSPSPDFFGGLRPGEDRDANSVVALRASTGERLWGFQLVHHDLWDYDVAAEPLLLDADGVPAVAVVAKTGMVFVLNRLTGKPIVPVEERAVPKTDVAGEVASATQPFSEIAMTALRFDPEALAGKTGADVTECAEKLRRLRYEGVFTPPSEHGTLQYPGSLGGVNWSGMAWDPETQMLYANTNGSAYEIRLIRRVWWRDDFPSAVLLWVSATAVFVVAVLRRRRVWPGGWAAGAIVLLVGAGLVLDNLPRPGSSWREKRLNSPDSEGEVSPQRGTPYLIYRRTLVDSAGRPCTPPPWGTTVAMKVDGKGVVWRRPLGTMPGLVNSGTVNFGAPVLTAGGLLFTAASQQPLLRAMDKVTGEELWQGRLPVPAQSTPMTYELQGRQYVVVSAGGHGGIGTPLGDTVMAFALPVQQQ